MSIDTFFYANPVFRHDEYVAWKTQQKALKAISINTSIQHYINAGKLIRIRRELYAVVPPDSRPEEVSVDPYLIAGRAAQDSILAYHTALELHGAAYSAFGLSTYLTKHKNKSFEFRGHWFQATASPAELKQQKITNTNVIKINRQGMDIYITNRERTYVDILDRIELSGGWEEVCRALQYLTVIDIDIIIEYCLLLNNARLAATVGFFLEKREGAFKATDQQLRRLLSIKPKNPQYATRNENDTFVLVKKWNILLPRSVINESWEEPNVDI